MFELGQMLRKARMEKGITLDSLQETTKIRKRYLEAIEDGNFKILPGTFYVRAFIKSYAEAVGLDPNDVLKLYGSAIPSLAPESVAEPPRRRKTNFRVADRWNKWATRIMFWSFLLLIVGIIYYFVGLSTKGDDTRKVTEDQSKHLTNRLQSETQSETPSPEAKMEAQAVVTPAPTPTPQPEVKLLRSENNTDYYQVAKSSKLTVMMKITGKACWFQLDKIGAGTDSSKREMMEQKTLLTGEERTWEVDKSAFLTLGAANAVELTVNGVPIPVGDSANVRRFQFLLPNT